MPRLELALAGCGFVGSTYLNALKEGHSVYVVDPKLNENKLSDRKFDGVVLCLPTPSDVDGKCDFSILQSCFKDIDPETPVLIKSTLSIEGYESLKAEFDNPISFSPEFLRQDTAERDLRKSKNVILSGRHANFWHRVLLDCPIFKHKMFSFIQDIREAITVKYMINSFLATKVAWFNQVYDYCEANGLDYNRVRNHIGHDDRIGKSHTEVTEERGFGGACFPKDTRSLLSEEHGDLLTLLNNAVRYNSIIREA
jgi:UDPglucose 6-dehydrogenase